MIVALVAGAGAVLLCVLYSCQYLYRDGRRSNVRGPRPLPLLGNGHLLLGAPQHFPVVLSELAEKYDDAVRFYICHKRFVQLSHPKYIKPILTSNEVLTKGNTYKLMEPWLGQGLALATGDKWRTHRKLLTPAFHFNILQTFFPIFLKHEKVLKEKLLLQANGEPFDVFSVITFCTLDIVTESIMGLCVNAQKDTNSPYVKAVDELSALVGLRQRNPVLISDTVFNMTRHKCRQDELVQLVHGHTDRVIDERSCELQAAGGGAADFRAVDFGILKNKRPFLDLLLLAEVDGKRLNYRSIRDEVNLFMFAGHDTTATSVSFCLYCLASRNDVQENIIEEQRRIFGDDFRRDPTFKEVKQMTYLDMVIKESLRLYPAGPVIERYITRDIELGGLKLLKDTTVMINFFRLHRNPKLFEDPLEFRPERFEKKLAPFTWLPFSAGPRNCIGETMRMYTVKLIVREVATEKCDSFRQT